MSLTKKLAIKTPSAEQVLTPKWATDSNIHLSVKRDDLIHPVISGNKWRKLKYALIEAEKHKVKHIGSFGGGFSNHLHALGFCCHQLNIQLTAIVRGDYSHNLTPMLQDLMSWKTDIQYVDKATYSKRNDTEYLQTIKQNSADVLIIPEGGSQQQALRGVKEIVSELTHNYDYIMAPVASGGTLAGLINGVAKYCPNTKIIGVGVLKGQGYLEELVHTLLPAEIKNTANWRINHDYHFGGYAKSNNELNQFCEAFFQQTQVQIEPVYSGKLMFAIQALASQGFFPTNSRVLALHTGGLQGARQKN